MTDDVRDELPHDLNPSGFVGPYQFPDNSRRRWPGVIYLVVAALCVDRLRRLSRFADRQRRLARRGRSADGRRDHLDHVGLADARRRDRGARGGATEPSASPSVMPRPSRCGAGLRSRPTWRVLCYSAEDPPAQRGLVLVDAIDGAVVQYFVEANPDADVLLSRRSSPSAKGHVLTVGLG